MTPEPVRTMIEGVPVLTTGQAAPAPWWSQSLRQFRESVGQRDYPCHFGRLALARGELYAVFCDQLGASLADRLSWFLTMSRDHLDRKLVLAAFYAPQAAPGGEAGVRRCVLEDPSGSPRLRHGRLASRDPS